VIETNRERIELGRWLRLTDTISQRLLFVDCGSVGQEKPMKSKGQLFGGTCQHRVRRRTGNKKMLMELWLQEACLIHFYGNLFYLRY